MLKKIQIKQVEDCFEESNKAVAERSGVVCEGTALL